MAQSGRGPLPGPGRQTDAYPPLGAQTLGPALAGDQGVRPDAADANDDAQYVPAYGLSRLNLSDLSRLGSQDQLPEHFHCIRHRAYTRRRDRAFSRLPAMSQHHRAPGRGDLSSSSQSPWGCWLQSKPLSNGGRSYLSVMHEIPSPIAGEITHCSLAVDCK